MFAIEVSARSESEEELRAVGVGACVRHGEDAFTVVAEEWGELVLEPRSEHRDSALPRPVGVASLDLM